MAALQRATFQNPPNQFICSFCIIAVTVLNDMENNLPPLDRRRLRKATTRASILAAAEHIVFTQGPHALTAKSLAKQADVSERTIFNHFRSLEDILLTRIADYTSELMQEDANQATAHRYPAELSDLPATISAEFREGISSLRGQEALVRVFRLISSMAQRDEQALSSYLSQMFGTLTRDIMQDLLSRYQLSIDQQYSLSIYVSSLSFALAQGLAKAHQALDITTARAHRPALTADQLLPHLIWSLEQVDRGQPTLS